MVKKTAEERKEEKIKKDDILLAQSARKWLENMKINRIKDAQISALDCPLCDEYFEMFSFDRQCRGCPVKNKTGIKGCMSTPYDGAARAANWGEYLEEKNRIASFKHWARREVNWLVSLMSEKAREDFCKENKFDFDMIEDCKPTKWFKATIRTKLYKPRNIWVHREDGVSVGYDY